MSMVPTFSIVGASVSRARAGFPVLLYSPAWAGRRNENTFHAQELASHGYIVVAIDHPYDSEFVVFPQGRVVHTRLVWGDPFASETAERKFVSVAERQIRVRAEDAVLVLDTLAEINSSDASNTFTGKLDLNRVGIFGFSLGGGAALQACWLDRRFKAGIDMDGLIAAESAKDGPTAPFLFLIAEVPLELDASIEDPIERRRIAFDMRQIARMRELSERSGVRVETLAGLSHFNFSDAHFYSPWPSPATSFGARVLRHFRFWPDSMRAESTARLINHHIRAFFDRHLRGMDSPWPAEARGEDP
jgi:dienelactone hydrolase